MTTVSQLAASDAYVRSGLPTKNYAGLTTLPVGVPASNTHYAFLYFNRPFPIGATIVSATLNLHQKGAATGGTRTLAVARLASSYLESKLTYANRPLTTGSAVTLAQGNSAVDGRLWAFDVTAMMQTVADGAAWYGLRVSADLTTLLNLYSRESSVFQPTLDIVWSDAPDAPSTLAPSNGRAVSIVRPTLRFDFTDVAGDTSMLAYQVQIHTSDVWTAPLIDTGTVASNIPEHTLTADTPTSVRWWRVRVQDGAGVWSAWSDGVSFTRTAKPTLTITNPAAGPNDFVTESTPPISWTATGQVAYQVFITDPVDTTQVLWTSGKVTSTDNSVTLPTQATPILSPGGTYSVTVRVWDNVDRESTPGDPVYVQASRVFTFDLSNTVDPVSAFTVTGSAPRPDAVLGWTRATAPDSFTILRDGVTIAEDLVPADLLISGTTYSYIDVAASPRGAGHTWSVIAVENGVSSDDNPDDAAILLPEGIWLSTLDGSASICIAGAAPEFDSSEDSTVHLPLGATNPVLITQGIHGRTGRTRGFLRAHHRLPDVTLADWLEAWEAIRAIPGQTLSMVLVDSAIKVFIYNTLDEPGLEFTGEVPISFDLCELL